MRCGEAGDGGGGGGGAAAGEGGGGGRRARSSRLDAPHARRRRRSPTCNPLPASLLSAVVSLTTLRGLDAEERRGAAACVH
eukprot:2614786-Rhodomonas_salina.1